MDSISQTCKKAEMPVGTIPFAGISASGLFEKGFSMVAAGSDVTIQKEGLLALKTQSY